GGGSADGETGERGGQSTCGFVFRHVAFFKARGDDLADTRLLERVDVRPAQEAALLEGFAAHLLRMGEDGAFRLVEAHIAEDHLRSVSVISAMMEMAISAGLLAPMARPTGPWMRAISSCEKPASER